MAAARRALPILQPERIRRDPDFLTAIKSFSPDVIIVVAFGQILPEEVLQIPPFGCINLHASLLPKHRGASPIQWAIVRGETETGVTSMLMDPGMDSGPILLRRSVSIGPQETAKELGQRLSHLGASLMAETLSLIKTGPLTPIAQAHTEATYAPILKKEDGLIQWVADAEAIFNRWRGLIDWPGTTTFHHGRRLNIPLLKIGSASGAWGRPGEVLGPSEEGLEVAAGRGYIMIQKIHPEGKRPMAPSEYAAGHPIPKGSFLGPK
jgi:methionyl-tRNA formyltransferase